MELLKAIVIPFAVTIGSQWVLYRMPFRIRAKNRDLKNARKEVVTLLNNEMAKNKKGLEFPIVRAVINSNYGEQNIDSIPPTEIQALFDDLIASLTKNSFISLPRRNELAEKALVWKQGFEKKETDLSKAIDNWRKVSKFRVAMRVVFILAVGIFVGLTTFIISALRNPLIWNSVIEAFFLIVIASTLFGYLQYRRAKEERDKSSHNLHIVLEGKVAEALETYTPKAMIETNVTDTGTGKLIEVDLIISRGENRVPVEIKHRQVRPETLRKLDDAMTALRSKKGLLVTSTSVGDEIEELARRTGIVILDNVASEGEIVNRLRHTKLFD